MKTYPVITRMEPAGKPPMLSFYATGSLKTEKPTVHFGRNADNASSLAQVLSDSVAIRHQFGCENRMLVVKCRSDDVFQNACHISPCWLRISITELYIFTNILIASIARVITYSHS